jgi:hypothetical protein
MHNVLIAVDRPNYARENDEQDDDEQVNQGVPIVQAAIAKRQSMINTF